MEPLLYLLSALLLLLASGTLSGSETAFFSLKPAERAALLDARRLSGWAARHLLVRPNHLLMTLLLGNLLVNLLYLSLATELSLRLEDEGRPGLAVAVTVGAVLALVLLAEVLPKNLARSQAVRVSRWMLLPILVLERLLLPAVVALSRLTDRLSRWLVGKPYTSEEGRKDVARLIDLSHRKRLISPEQHRFLHEVLEFSELTVRDVMVPRVDVGAIDLSASREQALEEIARRRVSCLVACRGDLDRVPGQILAHQVVLQPDRELDALVRPIPAVPEQGSAEGALARLRRTGSTIALVVDEYGGTAGIVTLHDLVVEIVGDLGDEHRRPGLRVVPAGKDSFLVAGWTTLREWREHSGAPEEDPESSTVGGLVVRSLDRTPRVGDEVLTEFFRYRVRRVRRGRIVLLEATPSPRSSPPGTSESSGAPTP